MEIVVATKNKGKIKEIQEVLEGLNIRVLSPDDLGLEIDVEEDGKTYIENAVKKAVEVTKRARKIALADDSGLEIDALNGRPGINSSRFAGDDADDRERNLKILEMMKDVPHEKRGARFKCVIAVATPPLNPPLTSPFSPPSEGGEGEVVKGGAGGVYTCEGVCEGEIAEEIRGDKGFGYDPIFIVSEYGKTFGELGAEIKNKISHRAKAMEKAVEVLMSLEDN
ncbi:MAG: non-canonical purine NTP pyrophosphatase [Nitrospinae bacterium]|nr:non-canonical purine NTP pyrophosphatase [Nitrospinota bacterium]MBI3814251.1 non-canonical purine NTP pyrophosphatase [Nitrospinota bacterium]